MISIPGVVIGFVVVVPALVVLLPVALVWDLARRRNLPTVRMLLYGTAYLGWEVVASAASGALWIAAGFGRFVDRGWSQRAHTRLQSAWVASLLGLAERILKLRVEVHGADVLRDGPIALLSRHASMVDTLIPAKLLFDAGMTLRYVLKEELLWDPALDLVGHRLPNYFVDRSGTNTDAELAAISALAAGAGEAEAVVIFPEGTRWSPAKQQSAVARVAERDPERGERVAGRRHTLPPRPSGTIAVLRGSPGADPVVMAHTGLEGLAGPKDALRMVPFRHPVTVQLWRVPRAELPDDDAGLGRWLDDQWQRVDDWVAANRAG